MNRGGEHEGGACNIAKRVGGINSEWCSARNHRGHDYRRAMIAVVAVYDDVVEVGKPVVGELPQRCELWSPSRLVVYTEAEVPDAWGGGNGTEATSSRERQGKARAGQGWARQGNARRHIAERKRETGCCKRLLF